MGNVTLNDILKATKNRKPDFNNILSVVNGKAPDRPTLFEFFLNLPLERKLAQWDGIPKGEDEFYRCRAAAFENAGYDYITICASDFRFKHKEQHTKASKSINEGSVISDRESFNTYQWEDPANAYNGRIEQLEKILPDGMKFVVHSPDGILENVISLFGYDNLCYMLSDDPELVGMVFDHVGQRIYNYYQQIIGYQSVGAIIANDDWGFGAQTMLSTTDMRKYVFKWYKMIVKMAHDSDKPVILHSCGNLTTIWGDIIDDMRFDAKHSYEDKIAPVERMYEDSKGRIAILGGIDVDFMCRRSPEEICARSRAILEQTGCVGYALGTGNSVPEYLPDDNYFAMISSIY